MKPAIAESRVVKTECVSARLAAITIHRANLFCRPKAIAAAIMLLAMLGVLSCHHPGPLVENDGPDSLALTSSEVRAGQKIPDKFTCNGANISPALAWSTPPAATQSFALILNDRNAPSGSFVHWVIFDLPATALSLDGSVPAVGQLADGARQGRNDFDNIGYGGPCPGHSEHHYVFMLFALDTKLNLPPGATRSQLDDAIKDHVLARGKLTATFHR
jgi:Raf kinase inhibitor-like YbhB/YbcL family protein